MDILRLNSRVKLGCNMCDKCCVHRGDIRLTPLNVCEISKYLNISIKEFIEKYTDRPKGNALELVLKTTGDNNQCILYNEKIHGCGIHNVKPMQCVMFPLVPENLKRDYFSNSEECMLEDAKEITVDEWLNGNNNIYSKHKKMCMDWIDFIEYVQPQLNGYSKEEIDKLYKMLFEDYNVNDWNLKLKIKKRMFKIKKIIIEDILRKDA